MLVTARVNDSEPFPVSLFPVGGGQHWIRIKAKVRQETQTVTGDRIRVHITVRDRAVVTIPEDLMSALLAEGAMEDFQSLPPGKQNFLVRRIDEVVRPETRQKRVQEAVEAAEAVAAALRARGHQNNPLRGGAIVQAFRITRGVDGVRLDAANDPRKGGRPAGR